MVDDDVANRLKKRANRVLGRLEDDEKSHCPPARALSGQFFGRLWLCRLSLSDWILECRANLSRSGVRANALDHGAHAVRVLRREMLLEAQRAKGPQGVDGENLLRRSIGEKRDRERDQPAHNVRVAVAAIVQDRLAADPCSILAFQPHLTDATPHLVDFIVGRLAQWL